MVSKDPYKKAPPFGIFGLVFGLPALIIECMIKPYLRTNIGRYGFSFTEFITGLIGTLVCSVIFYTPLSHIWWVAYIVMSIFTVLHKRRKVNEIHTKYVGDSIVWFSFFGPKLKTSDPNIIAKKHEAFRHYKEPFFFAAIFFILGLITKVVAPFWSLMPLSAFCILWGITSSVHNYMRDIEDEKEQILLSDRNFERMHQEGQLRQMQGPVAESMGGDLKDDWTDEDFIVQ